MMATNRIKYSVEVCTDVEITLELEAFSPEFIEQYQRDFFYLESAEDHATNIARMAAQGLISCEMPLDKFVEGYGDLSRFVGGLEIRRTVCVVSEITGSEQ